MKPSSPTPLRVLVAEDDCDLLEMLSSALESHDVDVVRARHGGEALALLRDASPRPELILLDLRMRVMGGKEFLAQKQADPALADIPVVVMTALDKVDQRATGLEVAGWLSKPLRLHDLYETVEAFRPAERTGGP